MQVVTDWMRCHCECEAIWNRNFVCQAKNLKIPINYKRFQCSPSALLMISVLIFVGNSAL